MYYFRLSSTNKVIILSVLFARKSYKQSQNLTVDLSSFLLEAEIIFNERSKRVQEQCKKIESHAARDTPAFIWIEKLDLLYLNIPKVASTTWKTLIKKVPN